MVLKGMDCSTVWISELVEEMMIWVASVTLELREGLTFSSEPKVMLPASRTDLTVVKLLPATRRLRPLMETDT